jgi:lysophospholipase L1-like esterase
VRPPTKKLLFVLLANLLGFALVVGAAEFGVRWRTEHGFLAAWQSFGGGGAPFSDLGTRGQLVADPVLGYRWNPARPGTNSLGLHNAEIVVPKPPGRRRLIVLGDSVAAPRRGFVGILQQRLQDRVEVINAAVPGYTTYQERTLLERDLLATEPDVVLLQYCVNDNHRFLHRFDAANQMLFTEEAQRALLPSQGWTAALARHSYLWLRLRLALLRLRAPRRTYPWEEQADVGVAWQESTWPEFEGHLRAMRDELAARGARLAVVMPPYAPQLDPHVRQRGPESYVLLPQRKMAEICARLGTPLLDLYPVFLPHRADTLFTDTLHLTDGGHALAAAAILEFLGANGLI